VAKCTGTLFKSQNSPYLTGTVYRNNWNYIVKACNEYLGTETNITAHRLRHNFCSLLCYQVPKISTKTIAKILGDTEEMVLKVYSHILEEKEDLTGAIESAFE
jgi:integrase